MSEEDFFILIQEEAAPTPLYCVTKMKMAENNNFTQIQESLQMHGLSLFDRIS